LKLTKKKLISTQTSDGYEGNVGDGAEFSEDEIILEDKILSIDISSPPDGTRRGTAFDKINKYGANFSMWAC